MSKQDRFYGIAYLVRKTSLSLTDIGKLKPGKFWKLLEEVAYQESVVEYNTARMVATIMASIANTIPSKSGRDHKTGEFMAIDFPKRAEAPGKNLESLAAKAGIKMPQIKQED